MQPHKEAAEPCKITAKGPFDGLWNDYSAPLFFDGQILESVAALERGALWPEAFAQHRVLLMTGRLADGPMAPSVVSRVFWNQRSLPFRSTMHRALVERAMRTKFSQHPKLKALLQLTRGKTLSAPHMEKEAPLSGLNEEEFCDVLTRIRDGATPRWPYGTHEEPLLVLVEPHGEQWKARLANNAGVWEAGRTKQQAIDNFRQTITSAHPWDYVSILRFQDAT